MRSDRRRALLASLGAASLALVACSDPSLPEACAAYCQAVADAGCPGDEPEECPAHCDRVVEQYRSEPCAEEQADVFDCAASADYACGEWGAVVVSDSCTDETIDLFDCRREAREGS